MDRETASKTLKANGFKRANNRWEAEWSRYDELNPSVEEAMEFLHDSGDEIYWREDLNAEKSLAS